MNTKTFFCAGIIGIALLSSGCNNNLNQNSSTPSISNSLNNSVTDDLRNGLQNNFSGFGNNDNFNYDYNYNGNYDRLGNSINITGSTSSPDFNTYSDNSDILDDFWGSFKNGIVTSENYKLDNSWMPSPQK